jgi:hypothetical protein
MDQKARYSVPNGPSIAAEDVVGKDAALLLWLVMLVILVRWRRRRATGTAGGTRRYNGRAGPR